MVCRASDFRRVDDDFSLSFACSDEEDDSAASSDFLYYFCGATEVGEGNFEGDDVDAVADTEDIVTVSWVPECCRVTEMTLIRQEHW